MLPPDFLAANSLVWPLTTILFGLMMLRWIKRDFQPIFTVMLGPLKKQAESNAMAWIVGMMLATLATLQALSEAAQQMGWIWLSVSCKILQPGLATFIAFVRPSPVGGPPSTEPVPVVVVQPPAEIPVEPEPEQK